MDSYIDIEERKTGQRKKLNGRWKRRRNKRILIVWRSSSTGSNKIKEGTVVGTR